MDLRSDYPYWLLRHGIIHSYPSLKENASAGIAIIGGGISGALTAWHLQHAGFRVLLVDRRHIGMGSTVASTTLLQYEIDVPLHKLVHMVGKDNAIQSYLLCRQAIEDIGEICTQVKGDHLFQRRPSFQFATYKKHVPALREEFLLRKKNGIKLQWLGEEDTWQKFKFRKPAGILSADGAEADAYALTHALLKDAIAAGLRVYDHTAVAGIRHTKKGVELLTDSGKKITAGKLVIACGYESQRYLPVQVQQLRSTYAIASEPFSGNSFWYKNSLIWETDDPYTYIRTTADNRVLAGGKDIMYSDPVRRDKLLRRKTRELEKAFSKLFPSIPFRTDFSWAGTFGTTKDGLPYIGSIRQLPHTYFALGFGGNGITFSVLAAQIIRDILKEKKNKSTEIFSFDR